MYDAYDRAGIILLSVCIPSALLAVVLRLYARKVSQAPYGWDDGWAVISFLLFCVYCGFAMTTGRNGAGYDYTQLPLPVLEYFLKISWIAELFIPVCIAAAKFSILCFYNRIFSTHRAFARSVKIVAILNTMWLVAATIALIFQCIPVHKAWDPLVAGRCFNYPLFTVVVETPNSLIDLVMMALPIRVLSELRINKRYKYSLGGVFLLGGMVAIIGFIRIGILYRPGSLSYNLSAGGIWITIQLTFAVICCCLPTMRPVFEKVDSFVSRSTSYFTSSLRTPASGNTGGSSKDNIGGFNRLDVDQESEGWVPARSNAVITREDVKPGQRLEYPLGAISVQRSVDIV